MFKKCLVPARRLKQHESMSTKNYICILASAALLMSCAEGQKTKAPTTAATTNFTRPAHGPMPSPSPVPLPGKRTETGTVIAFTASQITLRTSTTKWIITRTSSTKVTGTLAVNSTVTVESNEADWHQVST